MKKQVIHITDAANRLRELLPCQIDDNQSFLQGLKDIFEEYLQIIESIDDLAFTEFITLCELKVEKLTKRKFFNFVSLVADGVVHIIETYLDGNPHEAYRQLDNLFSHNKVRAREPAHGYKYITKYIDGKYVNLFSHDTTAWSALYRIRIGEDISEDEMYHVPFDLREEVGTYRFSIPGWPAFYVGTSVDVCWEEVKGELEDNKNVYVVRMTSPESWMLFNLQVPPEFGSVDSKASARYLYYFLSTFPVLAASLVKVRKPNGKFKPEYIIPQMILQYVKSNSLYPFTGILYSSTKYATWSAKPSLNIVIPTKGETDGKYSKFITENFKIVDFKNLGKDDIKQKLDEFQNQTQTQPQTDCLLTPGE